MDHFHVQHHHRPDWFDVVEGFDTIIYAYAFVQYDRRFARKLFECNVLKIRGLVDAALETNVKKLIYFSTTEALDRKQYSGIVSEKDTWQKNKDRSEYSKSRFLGELEVWRAYAEGLDIIILAPTAMLYPGTSNVLVQYLIDESKKEFPNGLGSGGFVDLRDVVFFMANCIMHTSAWGEKFILNGHNIAYEEFIHLMRYQQGTENINAPWDKALRKILFTWRKILLSFGLRRFGAFERLIHQKIAFDSSKAYSTGLFQVRQIGETMEWTLNQANDVKL